MAVCEKALRNKSFIIQERTTFIAIRQRFENPPCGEKYLKRIDDDLLKSERSSYESEMKKEALLATDTQWRRWVAGKRDWSFLVQHPHSDNCDLLRLSRFSCEGESQFTLFITRWFQRWIAIIIYHSFHPSVALRNNDCRCVIIVEALKRWASDLGDDKMESSSNDESKKEEILSIFLAGDKLPRVKANFYSQSAEKRAKALSEKISNYL